jgi:hypothetical protein
VKTFAMADLNTHTTPSTVPIASIKEPFCTTSHLCVCSWDDCASFQRKIRELADPSHRWNSGLIHINQESAQQLENNSFAIRHHPPSSSQ